MRINGHTPAATPTPQRPSVLCVETQARTITASIVADAVEEAFGQRRTPARSAATPRERAK